MTVCTGCQIIFNRLARLLQEQFGFDWRKKLPVPPDHAAVMTSPWQVPTVQQPSGSGDHSMTSSGTSPELTEQQKLKRYEQFKEEGNAHVKKVRLLFTIVVLFGELCI